MIKPVNVKELVLRVEALLRRAKIFSRLRERFSDCPDFEIVTVRGLSYKAVKRVE